MVSTINNVIKEPTHAYSIVTNQILMFGGYPSQGERIFVYLSHYLRHYHSKPY